MQGTIKIWTPAVRHELTIIDGTDKEISEKSRELKNAAKIESGNPFILYLELQSKMNESGFSIKETI